MKRILLSAVFLIIAFASISAQQTITRFAVVDMEQINAAYENSVPTREQIIDVIRRAAQSQAITMVLDRNAPGIIWLSPAVRLDDIDITERVVAMIRSRTYTPTNTATTLTRFAVVDMNRLFSGYAVQSENAMSFLEKREQIQAEIERQTAELREIIENLNLAQQEGRQRDIRTLENQRDQKIRAIQNYIASSNAELERERERMVQIESRFRYFVTNSIRPYAESQGITMVMARDAPALLWFSSAENINRFDITGRVIEHISSGGP